MSANYNLRGDVAVITMDNPPVNGLGYDTRRGIVDGLDKALADSNVKAIVVTGAGKAFSGGADIREFGSPKAIAEPNLLSLIAAFEASPKPIVAAMHTVAMGGGLELALGCHYRVAAPGTQIALPEVKIGLIPGAGGTQRLPRVLGVETALNMIVSGEPVKSEMLAKLPGQKLIDKIDWINGWPRTRAGLGPSEGPVPAPTTGSSSTSTPPTPRRASKVPPNNRVTRSAAPPPPSTAQPKLERLHLPDRFE